MASKSSPPPLIPEELSSMLAAHRQWLRSAGKEGQEANLSGANLEGLDLDGYDLTHLDFRGANLARVKFGDAHVEGASFRAANLEEADLSKARGLLAPQLAGADLAGARLPEDLQEFAGLKHVDAASGHVQKIFFLLLLVCVYCWLTIAVTTDANLLNNFAEQPLPIIGTKINLVMFYWAAPFLLLCVYLYFHLCLQRLWEALAELPGVFPDGLPLPRRVHPWLWNGLVWAYFPRLQDRSPPLLGLQKVLAILLVWWAGPLTIMALWFRYLPAHDWTITILQMVFLTLALDGCLGFSLLTRATLRLKEIKPFRGKKPWRTVMGMYLLLVTAAIAGLLSFLSLGAIEGLGGDRPWVVADLREADVSLKPSQWKPEDLDQVRGAFLRWRNLRGAKAYKAFLAKADLQRANLQKAELEEANLQYANLSWANLQNAELEEANLQHANLQNADMAWANLREARLYDANLQSANLQRADFQEAKGLKEDQVKDSHCWPLAKYSQGMLKDLKLPPKHNENLNGDRLIGYQLPGANLRGAYLNKFNLRGANLQGATLSRAKLQQAKLYDANLQHANLWEANLQHANLLGANLQQAKLYDANLQQANLQRADFQEAKGLKKDQVRAARCWPLAKYSQEELKLLELPLEHNQNLDNKNLSKYQLPRADLWGALLSGFNLRGANLQGADLERADLSETDLTGADLYGAKLKDAFLLDAKGLTRDQLKSAIMDEYTRLPDDLKDLVPPRSPKP